MNVQPFYPKCPTFVRGWGLRYASRPGNGEYVRALCISLSVKELIKLSETIKTSLLNLFMMQQY